VVAVAVLGDDNNPHRQNHHHLIISATPTRDLIIWASSTPSTRERKEICGIIVAAKKG